MVTTVLDALLKKLTDIGLNSSEAKMYIALLTGGETTASKLAGATGIPRSRTYDVLDSLLRLGLIVEIPERVKRFRAADPREALLNMLYMKHQIYMRELEKKKAKAKALSEEIHKIIESGEGGIWKGEGIEIYTTPQQIHKRYQTLLFHVEREAYIFAKPPYIQGMTEWSYELPPDNAEVHFFVSEDFILEAPEAIKVMLTKYGRWEHRKLPELPVKGGIFDGQTVLFIVKAGPESVRGVVIHDTGLALLLKGVFMSLWKNAKPLTFGDVV